jgi:hypothetical protein
MHQGGGLVEGVSAEQGHAVFLNMRRWPPLLRIVATTVLQPAGHFLAIAAK